MLTFRRQQMMITNIVVPRHILAAVMAVVAAEGQDQDMMEGPPRLPVATSSVSGGSRRENRYRRWRL